MENKICVIIPTRKRLVDFKLFADSWMRTNKGKSIVVVGIDNDDNTYNEIINNKTYPFIYERQESKPFLKILNDLAVKYSKEYSCIAFLEDDVTFNSSEWEIPILNKINEIGKNAIVWCDDLLNHSMMVGVPFMNSNIIRTLGWMACPKFDTQYTDWYWLHLGQKLNSLYYFSNIVIEHRHFLTNKREKDGISDMILKQCLDAGEPQYYKSKEYWNDIERDVKKLK